MFTRPTSLLLALCALAPLAGCDMLGIEPASALAVRKEAEGKAVGAACRHAGRAIEDCYALNRKADKAAVFAGWREMNDYMRENKIETVAPSMAKADAASHADGDGEAAGAAAGDHAAGHGSDAEKPAEKPGAKAKAKSKTKGAPVEHGEAAAEKLPRPAKS